MGCDTKLSDQLRQRYTAELEEAQSLAVKADRTEQETERMNLLLAEPTAKGSLKALRAQIEESDRAAKALADAQQWAGGIRNSLPFPSSKGGGGNSATKGTDGATTDGADLDDDTAAVKAMKAWGITAGDSEIDKKYPTGGFKSLGHFIRTLSRSRTDFGALKAINDWGDLATKAAFGMGINMDPTADVFVPMQFSTQIYERMLSFDDIFARCDKLTIRGSSIRIPAWDDSSYADAYRHGGIVAYWEGEGDPFATSKLDKVRYMDFRLHKLMAGAVLSNELLEDSEMAVDQKVGDKCAEAINFRVNQAVWEGDGNGKPKGAFRVTGQTPLVVVSKEAGQATATIVRQNLYKLRNRMHIPSRANMTWHLNNDVEPTLQDLTIGSSGFPVYMPPGGLSSAPYSSIFGRPAMVSNFCETLGTQNDIVAADWSSYQLVLKGQARRDLSMHARFMTDEQVLRLVFRVDGQPKWDKPLTPLKGTTTTSTFVTLQARP